MRSSIQEMRAEGLGVESPLDRLSNAAIPPSYTANHRGGERSWPELRNTGERTGRLAYFRMPAYDLQQIGARVSSPTRGENRPTRPR